MTAQPYKDSKENQAAAQQITFNMLSGMLEVLNELERARKLDAADEAAKDGNIDFFRQDTEKVNFADPVRRRTRRELEAELATRPPSASLPLCYFHDTQELDAPNKGFRAGNIRLVIPRDHAHLSHYPLIDVETIDHVQDFIQPEHMAIMRPNNTLEAPFSVSVHLGENSKTEFFTVNGTKHAHGAGLTALEKIIYREAGLTAQGAACLPHENRARAHWSKDASQIKAMFSCTAAQATDLKKALSIIGLSPADLDRKRTPKSSAPADWLREMKRSPERFKAGFYWLLNLAAELDAVAPQEDEILDIADELVEDKNTDRLPDSDNPADIETVSATAYHLLDDPRDLIDAPPAPKSAPASARLKKLCDSVNGAQDYQTLKAIGKSTFGSTPMPKPEANIFWKIYNRRKREFAALNDTAKAAINRIKGFEYIDRRWIYTGKAADLKKVAAWLHGAGKTALNELQANAVWEAWKEAKGMKTPKAPKQTALPPEWIDDIYPGYADYHPDYHPEY
jgi:hypothetical protein